MAKRAVKGRHKRQGDRAVKKPATVKNAAPKSAPADVTPGSIWSPSIDQQLRDAHQANPRTAAKQMAGRLGLSFHVVKDRIKTLRLETPAPAPKVARRKRAAAVDQAETCDPAEQPATVDADAERQPVQILHAICPNRPACYTRAAFDPNDSPEKLIEQGFTYGLDPVTKYPVCANCRTTMVAAEPVDAPEAIQQAIAAGTSHQARLWADPPFNSQAALEELFAKRREVRLLKEASEAGQRAAKKAQKAYAKCLVEKDAMEETFETRMIEKQRESRIRVEQAAERHELAASVCIFEANTLKPCPVCRADSPSLVAAALHATNGSLTHIDTEAHRTLAIRANSRAIDVAQVIHDPKIVHAALTARGLLGLTVDVVSTWDEVQRREALMWADHGLDRTTPPAVIGLPHIAAAAGEDEQCCADCGARLLRLTADGDDPQPYPLGAMVGQFCTGIEVGAEMTKVPAQEVAHG